MPRFSKKSRLLLRKEFERVHKAGMRAGTNILFISFVSGDNKRLGLVVGKNAGTAVTRSRTKRVFREHFRLNADKYPCGDCVVIVKDKVKGVDNDELRKHLETALKKLRTILEKRR